MATRFSSGFAPIVVVLALALLGAGLFVGVGLVQQQTTTVTKAAPLVTRVHWEENNRILSDSFFSTRRFKDLKASGKYYAAIFGGGRGYISFFGKKFTLGLAKGNTGGKGLLKIKIKGLEDHKVYYNQTQVLNQRKPGAMEYYKLPSDLMMAKAPKGQCYDITIDIINPNPDDHQGNHLRDLLFFDYIDAEQCDASDKPVFVCKNNACTISRSGRNSDTRCEGHLLNDPCGYLTCQNNACVIDSSANSSDQGCLGGRFPNDTCQGQATVPTPIVKKVQVIIYDPILENYDNKRLSSHLTGIEISPEGEINNLITDMETVSGGYLKYQIAEIKKLDEYLEYTDGFKYNDETYLSAWDNGQSFDHGSAKTFMANFNKILAEHNTCQKLNVGEIDELWLSAYPYSGFWESFLAGPRQSFFLNGPELKIDACQKFLPVMGYDSSSGADYMLHDMGHRLESTMRQIYGNGAWPGDDSNPWSTFSLRQYDMPGKIYCGNVHFPPNVNEEEQYYYWSPQEVNTSCDDWSLYPDLPNPPTTKNITCTEWECTPYGYYKWWLSHIPKKDGKYQGTDLNWWKYFADLNYTMSILEAR